MSEDKDQFLNKRKYSRINLLDPIRVNLSDYTFEEYIGNLSKTGCMVLSLEKKEIDETLSISIKDPQKGYVKFNAIIKRCIEKEQKEVEEKNKEIKDLLFVDDDLHLNATATSSLEDDFSMDNCFNAAEARERLEEFQYRVVVCDARMPGEDGANLLGHIQKNFRETRRILLTGDADIDLMQRAVNIGSVEKVLYKPIDLIELRNEINSLLLKSNLEKNTPTTYNRYYNCYNCNYKAYRIEMDDGIKWQSESEIEKKEGYHYFQSNKDLSDLKCPKCKESTFLSINSRLFEIGLQFIDLSVEQNESIERIIGFALKNINTDMDMRKNSRVEGAFLPVPMEILYDNGAELFDIYISDISRGGVRINSKEEYKIGQEVNLKLGLVKGERFSISGRILNKTEEKENFKYGLQFTYFDNEQQAKLNHFIDSLALDSYKEREQDKQKKKIALGVGGAGFSGFAGGFAAAIILFGGFYFFKGYNTSKNQKTITITQEGKSYNISRHNLFEGNVKGLPKKLGKKVSSAYKACKKNGTLDKGCFDIELRKFATITNVGPRKNIEELEKSILSKGKNISPGDLEFYYQNIQNRDDLSEVNKKIKIDKFKLKVKRAIQLPSQN